MPDRLITIMIISLVFGTISALGVALTYYAWRRPKNPKKDFEFRGLAHRTTALRSIVNHQPRQTARAHLQTDYTAATYELRLCVAFGRLGGWDFFYQLAPQASAKKSSICPAHGGEAKTSSQCQTVEIKQQVAFLFCLFWAHANNCAIVCVFVIFCGRPSSSGLYYLDFSPFCYLVFLLSYLLSLSSSIINRTVVLPDGQDGVVELFYEGPISIFAPDLRSRSCSVNTV
ncbi:hypothetical protein F4779DRAFT_640067 [Xylariaceae sp. FL0662B]|nr:hypothetical protein F4779DRAFT_640067 [Xylariaceae sp. FL0662B]